ncbi:thiocillin family RiPP [Bacillus sp. FSL W7-1360]
MEQKHELELFAEELPVQLDLAVSDAGVGTMSSAATVGGTCVSSLGTLSWPG